MFKNDLVAYKKTRSFANNAPAGTVVQLANPSVVEAVMFTSPNEQYPKTIPLIVGAAGSSPTIRAEVLAVPSIFNVSLAPPIATTPFVALVIVSPFNKVMEVVEAIPSSWITPSVALVICSPLSKVKMVVVAPPRKVPRPVKADTPETVNAPVSAIVPSVALVIVSPFNKVIEVVEATPPSWMTPSVALLIISPLRSVKIVVVAPPARVANPSALIAPAAEIVTPESPKPLPTVKLVAAVCVGLKVPVTVKFPTTVDEAVERNPFENVPPVIEVVAAFKTIVPSVALVIVSPLSKVKIVVVAPPRKVAKLVTSKVEYKVAAPVAINVVD